MASLEVTFVDRASGLDPFEEVLGDAFLQCCAQRGVVGRDGNVGASSSAGASSPRRQWFEFFSLGAQGEMERRVAAVLAR